MLVCGHRLQYYVQASQEMSTRSIVLSGLYIRAVVHIAGDELNEAQRGMFCVLPDDQASFPVKQSLPDQGPISVSPCPLPFYTQSLWVATCTTVSADCAT